MTRNKNTFKVTKLVLSLVILFYFKPIASNAQDSPLTTWQAEADTLMSRQDFEGAIKLYTKIISTTKLKTKEDFKFLYKRAIASYSIGDFVNALQDINQFCLEFPESYQAHILSALIYRQQEDANNQLIELNKALALRDGNPELIKWRGALFMAKGENEAAKKDFIVVRSLQDDPELESNLGVVYYALQKSDSALLCFNKSIELDATYEPAYLYAGSFCLELERFALALKYLNLALLLNSENANALLYKGIALVELKRSAEGCRFLSKAFKAGQDDAGDYLKEYCYDIFK